MTKKEREHKKYGLLPPKIAESYTVSLGHGMCGSGESINKKDTSQNKLSVCWLALIMIDPATGWIEIVETTNKSATSIQDLFHSTWLARYPRPQFIVFDSGGEFKREFKQIYDNYGIKAKPTTSHNPQANAIIERLHKVVNDMFRSFDLENNHESIEEDNPSDYFL
jgi:transposase InsO family protein